MAPKYSNQNTSYKEQVKLNLDKLKKQQIKETKVSLTQINIKTLTTQLDLLSNDVKQFMVLPTSNRYYA